MRKVLFKFCNITHRGKPDKDDDGHGNRGAELYNVCCNRKPLGAGAIFVTCGPRLEGEILYVTKVVWTIEQVPVNHYVKDAGKYK